MINLLLKTNLFEMKRIIPLLVIILLVKVDSAQYSLNICASISEDGPHTQVSNSFQVDSKGSLLKIFVKSDEKFNTDQLDFKVFYVNNSGGEEALSTFSQKMDADWNYAWKDVVLFNPGNYRIKIDNDKETYLTSANLNIKR